jgi:hypothetical protein
MSRRGHGALLKRSRRKCLVAMTVLRAFNRVQVRGRMRAFVR